MRLTRYRLRQLIQEVLWYNSEDFDYQANTFDSDITSNFPELISDRVFYIKSANFNPKQDPFDDYAEEGMTHGHHSHTLKHYVEFNPQELIGEMNKAISFIIQNNIKVFVLSNGLPVPFDPSNLSAGDMINTLDRINDNYIRKSFVNFSEANIWEMFFIPLATKYDEYVESLIDRSTDVSDQSFPDLNQLIAFLKTMPIIKFEGMYSGRANTYYYEMQTTAMASQLVSGEFATLYKIEKRQRNRDPKISLRFFQPGKSTVPYDNAGFTFNNFRKAIDILSPKPLPPQKKQKPKKQNKKRDPRQAVIGMYRQGMDIAAISSRVNIPEAGVLGILTSAGLI